MFFMNKREIKCINLEKCLEGCYGISGSRKLVIFYIHPKFFEKGLVLERPFPYVQFASQEALTV